MTLANRDAHQPTWLREHVEAAVAAGVYTLPSDMTVDHFVDSIDLLCGVPSPGPAPKVATRPNRCLLCSQPFRTVDRHPVCWLCRSQTREEYAS